MSPLSQKCPHHHNSTFLPAQAGFSYHCSPPGGMQGTANKQRRRTTELSTSKKGIKCIWAKNDLWKPWPLPTQILRARLERQVGSAIKKRELHGRCRRQRGGSLRNSYPSSFIVLFQLSRDKKTNLSSLLSFIIEPSPEGWSKYHL